MQVNEACYPFIIKLTLNITILGSEIAKFIL